VECEAFDDASRSAAFLIECSLGRLCGGRAITTTDGVEVAPVDFTPHIVMWAPREAARVSDLNSIAFCAIDDRRRGAAPDLGACGVLKTAPCREPGTTSSSSWTSACRSGKARSGRRSGQASGQSRRPDAVACARSS